MFVSFVKAIRIGTLQAASRSVPTFVVSGVFHCCDYSDYYLAQRLA
jgi:hypothetical protein